MEQPLVWDKQFLQYLGLFHAAWATTELMTSFAIKRFLKISSQEAHILTAGMEMGRKITLLRNIIYRSQHPKKKELIKALGKLQNESLRNVFAHGYIVSSITAVKFIARSGGGDYKVAEHNFTLDEFSLHVKAYLDAGAAFDEALGFSKEELAEFVTAALSENNKSTTSPDPPNSNA